MNGALEYGVVVSCSGSRSERLASELFLVARPLRRGSAIDKVRISYSSRSNSNTPFIIALNKGFFAEEGRLTCRSERERGIFRNSV